MAGSCCAFCGAARPLVEISVLGDSWTKRYGGSPVVSLDHGWYTATQGEQQVAEYQTPVKVFQPRVRAVCDFCANGWVEDLRTRVDASLVALANGSDPAGAQGQAAALLRWALLSAMLAELAPELPTASSPAQRHAVKVGAPLEPPASVWLASLGQRLPARIHLSQVQLPGSAAGVGLIQVVSLDVAHFSALIVLPSDASARQALERSALTVEFGPTLADGLEPRRLDLARTPHPHRIAVHRLCSGSRALTS